MDCWRALALEVMGERLEAAVDGLYRSLKEVYFVSFLVVSLIPSVLGPVIEQGPCHVWSDGTFERHAIGFRNTFEDRARRLLGTHDLILQFGVDGL